MSYSRRKNEAQPLSKVLETLISENNWTRGLHQIQVQQIWAEQMGNGVMKYTHKLTLKGSTLLVELTSSVLREELSYGKDKIIQNLNDALGEKIIEKLKLM